MPELFNFVKKPVLQGKRMGNGGGLGGVHVPPLKEV